MRRFPADLSVSEPPRWHLGVGDPNALAWVTVGLYVVAAALAFLACRSAGEAARRLQTSDQLEAAAQRSLGRFWLLIGVSMVGMGANKQLDLQSLLIQIVRDRALRDGWYHDRGQYRLKVFALALVVGLAVAAALLYAFRHILRRVALALVGVALLALFVAVRATRLDDSDNIGTTTRPHALLEIIGISVIIGAALRTWRARPVTGAAVSVDDDSAASTSSG